MAYDVSKLTKLGQLKALAEKIVADYAPKTSVTNLENRINEIVATGGEPNTINKILVNGTEQAITEDKGVDIKIPGYSIVKDSDAGEFAAVYHLTKDGENVGQAINIPKDMVVKSGSVVTDPDDFHTGTFLKLVLQNQDEPIYINVGDLIEYVTSGSVAGDMVFVTVSDDHKVTATITDGTITKAKLDAGVQETLNAVANKVEKEAGKALSTNDFTDLLKAKLEGIAEGATKIEKSETNGNILINGVETVVYTEPTDVVHGAIASDEEVNEMLNEVFATE